LSFFWVEMVSYRLPPRRSQKPSALYPMKSPAALAPEFPESILTSDNRCNFNRKPSETRATATTRFELKNVDAASELKYCLVANQGSFPAGPQEPARAANLLYQPKRFHF